MVEIPPLRYLPAADVVAAMPALPDRLMLAERVLRALVADAELPAKIGLHPRPEASFAHAMPALLRGTSADGTGDVVGVKWVTGFPTNTGLEIASIAAVVLLTDPRIGYPIAILDGGPITAARTAAVSGVAIERYAPPVNGRPSRVGLIGAGVQARSHLPVLAHLLPGLELRVYDRVPGLAARFVAEATGQAGVAGARVAATAREAVEDADVVITVASFGPVRQVMTNDWLAPNALVIAVDYATYVAAEVARGAALFLVDDRATFLANRDAGEFDGYPDPTAMLGEALTTSLARPAGRVLVSHLGVGLNDVVFGQAILRAAEARDLGIVLPR